MSARRKEWESGLTDNAVVTGIAGQARQFIVPKRVARFARLAATVELGSIDVRREFDVRTANATLEGLLSHGEPGRADNTCTGVPHTPREVVDTLAELTGHCLQFRQDPAFMRPNEVARLEGAAARLQAPQVRRVVEPHGCALRHTLSAMLESGVAR